MIIGDVGMSSYNSSEIETALDKWASIMDSWDDNKSHQINDVYFVNIRAVCAQLIELGNYTQDMVNSIKRELDGI